MDANDLDILWDWSATYCASEASDLGILNRFCHGLTGICFPTCGLHRQELGDRRRRKELPLGRHGLGVRMCLCKCLRDRESQDIKKLSKPGGLLAQLFLLTFSMSWACWDSNEIYRTTLQKIKTYKFIYIHTHTHRTTFPRVQRVQRPPWSPSIKSLGVHESCNVKPSPNHVL